MKYGYSRYRLFGWIYFRGAKYFRKTLRFSEAKEKLWIRTSTLLTFKGKSFSFEEILRESNK
jgi:hypothetical protein